MIDAKASDEFNFKLQKPSLTDFYFHNLSLILSV
jgi:hypothetical protein